MDGAPAGTPTVSVVIPSYNNAAFIEETVQSVLGQTFEDFELIVADHSSTDGTWERLQRFLADPRVRLLQTPTGGGAERNWNAVTAEARGEYVKLVCGDDVLRPESLERQVTALQNAGPGAVMAASPRDIVDARGAVVMKARGLAGLRGRITGTDAVRATVRSGTNVFGEPASVLLRRPALDKAGGWDGRLGYLIDLATYVRVLERGDLIAVGESLATFRLSSTQWSARLIGDQARQSIECFRAVRARRPDILRRSDLLLGEVRAVALGIARRLVYLRLGRRLGAAEGASVTSVTPVTDQDGSQP